MELTRFNKPVSILVGLGYPAKVYSARQAYEFLSETPTIAARNVLSVALKVCKAAMNGEVDPETARSAFVAFADRSAILAPEGPFASRLQVGSGNTVVQGRRPDAVKGGV